MALKWPERLGEWLKPLSGRVDDRLFDREHNEQIVRELSAWLERRGAASFEGKADDAVYCARAIAQYRALVNVVPRLGPLWLRALAYYPALAAGTVLLLIRGARVQRGLEAEVVGVTYYPVLEACVHDALGETATAAPPPAASLSLSQFGVMLRVWISYPSVVFYPELLLRSLLVCGRYGTLFRRHGTRLVGDFIEYSPASSLAMAFCRAHGMRLSNIMHGDRAYSAVFAFGTFDDFFVWGEHYRELFRSLGVHAQRYSVFVSRKHERLGRLRATQPRPKRVLIPYEIAFQPGGEFTSLLADWLTGLPNSWKIRLRMRYVRKHEPGETEGFIAGLRRRLGLRVEEPELSDPERVELEEDLAASRIVVGVYSTVLLEGWLAGCRVVRIEPATTSFRAPQAPFSGSPNMQVYHGGKPDLNWLQADLFEDESELALLRRLSVGAARGAAAQDGVVQ